MLPFHLQQVEVLDLHAVVVLLEKQEILAQDFKTAMVSDKVLVVLMQEMLLEDFRIQVHQSTVRGGG